MALSTLDLFFVGVGPSFSPTVGPMRAARLFTAGLSTDGLSDSVSRVRSEILGSLGATGLGHGSDKAVILGLQGEDPETVDTAHQGKSLDFGGGNGLPGRSRFSLCDGRSRVVCSPWRNTIASTEAVNAARSSVHGDGNQTVALDQVIETMRETATT